MVSDGALRLLSGMSVNHSRSVQSNLWQETTSLWDTPAAHLYASQHHKQLDRGGGRGGLDLPQLSGEKYVSIFPLSVAEKTKQMLLYFPHYCSLVWISLLLSVFPQRTHSRGSPTSVSHYYPETVAQAQRPLSGSHITERDTDNHLMSNWNDLKHF